MRHHFQTWLQTHTLLHQNSRPLSFKNSSPLSHKNPRPLSHQNPKTMSAALHKSKFTLQAHITTPHEITALSASWNSTLSNKCAKSDINSELIHTHAPTSLGRKLAHENDTFSRSRPRVFRFIYISLWKFNFRVKKAKPNFSGRCVNAKLCEALPANYSYLESYTNRRQKNDAV